MRKLDADTKAKVCVAELVHGRLHMVASNLFVNRDQDLINIDTGEKLNLRVVKGKSSKHGNGFYAVHVADVDHYNWRSYIADRNGKILIDLGENNGWSTDFKTYKIGVSEYLINIGNYCIFIYNIDTGALEPLDNIDTAYNVYILDNGIVIKYLNNDDKLVSRRFKLM